MDTGRQWLRVPYEFASQVKRPARRQTLGWLITRFRILESEIMMATDRARYQAYMLRLWQDQDKTGPIWRASLESPHTGERYGFASLEDLFDFLRQRADQQVDGSPTLTQAASGGSD